MVRFIIRLPSSSVDTEHQDLHSNMVRFIIQDEQEKQSSKIYLHSNMVRFIMQDEYLQKQLERIFTFQYG